MKKEGEIKLKNLGIILGLFIIACAPTSQVDDDKALTGKELEERNNECKLYNSFAAGNMQNRDYKSTVENYTYMLDIGCDKCQCLGYDGEDAEYIYSYFGRAYIELGKLDSASYIFKKGLKYLKDDEVLLENAQWVAGKLKNLDEQIYYLDQWLALDESNLKVLNEFARVYKENKMFEEQIDILDMILTIDPGNKSANGEKKFAFRTLGKDELDVDKERWNSDQSNIQYGKEYAKRLLNKGRNEEVVEVCNTLLIYDKYDTQILKYLGDAHLNLYNEDFALAAYESISNIDKTDYINAIEIAKLYIDKEEYQIALKWAEKAVQFSGSKGIALNQRAEVYFSAAESCSSESLTFSDKLVFEIAWEDYVAAAHSGYIRARARVDFLQENNITTSGDWFMTSEKGNEVTPQGECYSWIKRSIKRKE